MGMAVAEGVKAGKSKKIFRTADGRKYSELDAFVERFDEAFLPNKEARNSNKL